VQPGYGATTLGFDLGPQTSQATNLAPAPALGSGDFGMRVNSTPAAKIPKKAVLADSGVLYQDGNIQIGFKYELTSGKGRVMLYYGNMTTNPITGFSANCLSKGSGMTVVGQAVPNSIEGKTQATQAIVVECLNDFEGTPTLEVAFLAGGVPTNLHLELPVTVCKFMETSKVQGGDFFKEWKMYENPPQSETVIVKSNGPIDIASLNKLLSTGFHFTVLQGVDPNANNVVATSNFKTQSQNVLVLLRIETNPQHNMYRVTVKSKSAKVTAALKDLLNDNLAQ
jgi:AP-2 complex subunit alpha